MAVLLYNKELIIDHDALPVSACGAAESPVRIGDDAWIGMNAVVLKGVSIGQGAIVAAGSVVTRDVEPFTVVAGSPAVAKAKLIQTAPRHEF